MTEQQQIKEAFEDLLKSLRKETSKENRQNQNQVSHEMRSLMIVINSMT